MLPKADPDLTLFQSLSQPDRLRFSRELASWDWTFGKKQVSSGFHGFSPHV